MSGHSAERDAGLTEKDRKRALSEKDAGPIAAAKAEALRDAARYLRRQGGARFEIYGAQDARGAALWDAGCAIDPDDGDALGGTYDPRAADPVDIELAGMLHEDVPQPGGSDA